MRSTINILNILVHSREGGSLETMSNWAYEIVVLGMRGGRIGGER